MKIRNLGPTAFEDIASTAPMYACADTMPGKRASTMPLFSTGDVLARTVLSNANQRATITPVKKRGIVLVRRLSLVLARILGNFHATDFVTKIGAIPHKAMHTSTCILYYIVFCILYFVVGNSLEAKTQFFLDYKCKLCRPKVLKRGGGSDTFCSP